MRSFLSILLIACLICSCKTLHSQPEAEDESGIFAYANNDKGKLGNIILKKQHYKYDIAHKVLMDLVDAKGDMRMPVPSLKFTNAERRVAYAKPNDAIIGLEMKAYDICASFGKDSLNALAVLLAHELTHYYEKHDWTSHFVDEHDNMDVSHSLESLNEKMKLETQADYLGGFLAYTAGYPTLNIMPSFLQKVYDGYGFPDKMKGYPILSERQQIATRALEKLEKLVEVFEAANWMVAANEYETALTYYNYILLDGQFQSREVYNNMGVLTVLAAMTYSDPNEKFFYPVELDPVSRIGKRGTDILGHGAIREKLLKQGIDHFKAALSLDENYATAYLNIASANTLLDNYFDADYHVQKAIYVARDNDMNGTISNAECLLGIIAARKGDLPKANQHFDKSIAQGNALAKANKAVANDESNGGNGFGKRSLGREKIDGLNFYSVIRKNESGSVEWDKETKVSKKCIFAVKYYPESKILKHENPFDGTHVFLHVTNPGYSGATIPSIRVGSSVSDLITAYGNPTSYKALTNGAYLYFQNQNLIFSVKDDAVTGWCAVDVRTLEDDE